MNDNLLSVLKPIYRWRKYILYTVIATTLGCALIALLLPNYYKSTTIFYSASPDLAKPAPMGPMDVKMDFYGEDEDLDRLFSICNSNEVFSFLVEKFDLYNHYDINPELIKAPHTLRQKFRKLFEVQKTKYNALQLSVEDKDPKFSADMANASRDKVSEISQRVLKQSQKYLLNSLEENIKNKEAELKTDSDSLQMLRQRYGVFSTNSQGEVLAGLYAENLADLNDAKARYKAYKSSNIKTASLAELDAIIEGLTQQTVSIAAQVSKFNKGLDKVMSLEFTLKESSEQLGLDKERMKLLSAAHGNPFTALHLVESAEVPVVKSRPKRSILVLAVMVLSFFLASLAALLFDRYKSVNWNELKDA